MPNAPSPAPGDQDPAPALVERIHTELLAARKRPSGLSPTGMTALPTVVALLGDGDPLLAFTQLQDRILQTIGQADDSLPIQAAAYSLGLASDSDTHLGRLTDFGADFGFEARQARRHSDTGLRRLARLIATNWTVPTTPQCRIYLTSQPDGVLILGLDCVWPWFIDMHPPTVHQMDASQWSPWQPPPVFTQPADPAQPQDSTRCSTSLIQPLRLDPHPRPIRLQWAGEIWPQFITTMTGLPSATSLSTTTLGNTWILSPAGS